MTPAALPVDAGLVEILDRIVAPCEREGRRYMLVGALAAFAWADARTTGDLDVAVSLEGQPPETMAAQLATSGWPVHGPVRSEFGQAYRVAAPLLPVEVFLLPPTPLHDRELARALEVDFAGRTFRVVSPEDFVLRKLVNMKLRRDPNDRRDAWGTLYKGWESFDFGYVRQHCAVQRVCGWFEALVEDVRAARTRDGLPTPER